MVGFLTDTKVLDANNTTFAGNSTDVNVMKPSDARKFAQALQGAIARAIADQGGTATLSGTNTYTATLAQAYTAYGTSAGQIINGTVLAIKPTAANTTAATVNFNTIGAKAIRLQGDSALVGGEMLANGIYLLRYDTAYNSAAGAWVLLNPSSNAAATTSTAGIVQLATNAQTVAPPVGSTLVPTIPNLYYQTGHLFGCTISNNGVTPASKIDVAAGTARDSTDLANIQLTAALTAKDLASGWAVGSSAGLLDTGSIANTTYHIYLIKRPDTGVVDVIASTSASAPTLPSNYTLYRRIGAIIRTGGSIVTFTQLGDYFWLTSPVVDVTANNPGSSAVTRTLNVPIGVSVVAIFRALLKNTANGASPELYLSALVQTDSAPSQTSAPLEDAWTTATGTNVEAQKTVATKFLPTNTSGQIRSRTTATDASCTLYISTYGWMDNRGRLY